MNRIILSLFTILGALYSSGQINITNEVLAEQNGNALRYELSFTTNEAAYSFIEYSRIVTDSLGNTLDTVHEHTALFGPSIDHEFVLIGLIQETNYNYSINAFNEGSCYSSDNLSFETDSLPTDVSYMDSLYIDEEANLDGYYLTNNLLTADKTVQIYDRDGNVVWYDYHSSEPGLGMVQNCQMFNVADNDNLLTLECHQLTERDFKGNVIANIDFNNTIYDSLFFHHDAIINNAGNYVVVCASPHTFPSGDTTITVISENLLEFNSDGEVVWSWVSLDHFDAYDAVPSNGFFIPLFGVDAINWMHCNTVHQDTDGHYILSFKEWHQILKINSETGDVMWTLGGDNADIPFLPFDEFGDQHDINRTDSGTYIIYDNTGLDTLSRIMEFSIDFYKDPVANTEWEFILPQENFSAILGTAKRMENDNRYCMSGVTGSIFEVDAAGEVMWHLRQNNWAYRCYFVSQLFENSIENITIGTNPELVCWEEDSFELNAMPLEGYFSGNGVSNGMFDPNEAGVGMHTITYKWGWNTASFEIEVSDQTPPCVVSIDEIEQLDNELNIFPNPSKGNFNVQFSLDESSKVSINLTDALGRTVTIYSEQNFSEGLHSVNISQDHELSAGIYTINLLINDRIISDRLIITE